MLGAGKPVPLQGKVGDIGYLMRTAAIKHFDLMITTKDKHLPFIDLEPN